MNYKNSEDIQKEYSKFFLGNDNENDIQHLKQMLMYRFLSEIERICEEHNVNKKQLAKLINISPSYLTQLYRGIKPLNIETLAKIESALDFRFEIKAIEKDLLEIDDNAESSWSEEQLINFINKFKSKGSYWAFSNKNKELKQKNITIPLEIDYSNLGDQVSSPKLKNKLKSA